MKISEYTIHTQYNHIQYMCIDLYICLGWSVATKILFCHQNAQNVLDS